MGLQPSIFLLGLLLLFLEQGTTQALAAPGRNTLEEQLWPELQFLRDFSFPCKLEKPRSKVPPKSVHSLRPSDIKVVAAIGNLETPADSGMISPKKQKWTEKRSHQPCALVTVLSEVIRHFNPSVLRPMCPAGTSAVHHSDAVDLWVQARELVRSMKENLQLNFQNDWKIINVFFSNANQCHLCPSTQQKGYVLDTMDKLTRMLDYLHQEVPKAFVNLVDLSEATGVSHWHQGIRLSQEESCRCVMETSKLSRVMMQWSYQETWEKLLAISKYNEEKSFAVVFQPFFSETALLSDLGEPTPQNPTALALNLWNSMLEPAGQKDEPFSAEERKPMKCPTQEKPYLFTYKNSNYPPSSQKPFEVLEKSEGTEVSCPDKTPSNSVPTSVHRLKPADIKVIGALGDSLTAGNGAGSKPGDILDVLTQYRGLSWSVGGDQNISTVITLANILREFNPALKGFSVGTGKPDSPGAFFNQAVAGNKAQDLPVQARKLVDLMRNDKSINFQNDWKIITMFIGGNDLCDICNDPDHYSPRNFTGHIGKALDLLHAEVPRAFVNLVMVLSITPLRELYQEQKVKCPRMLLRLQCPCVLKFEDNSAELANLIEQNKMYQEETYQLIESGQYDTREDFTVVVQPFLKEVKMPKTPLEPVNQKTTQHDFQKEIDISCPNQVRPFLSTYKNTIIQGHGSWLMCRDRAPSASPPTSVHALRPADIQVVAALGDSLTAGNGIGSNPDDFSDVTTQYRGLSYSSGGDGSLSNVTTLPNILREFNQNLTGYAVGTGDANSANAFLNQAVPGAKAKDLSRQVQTLVQRMKEDQRVNFQEDWKIITVLIGGSDLCDYCKDPKLYSETNFYYHLLNALDILHREVPRALVNLVDFMNPSVIRQVFLGNPSKCPVQNASLLCDCVLSPPENSQELARLKVITQAYQDSMRELVESGRYDTREDFTVVLQPFFHNVQLPVLEDGLPDTSFFAPDCIHPSQKFHSQLSRALWSNMLQPLGKKTDTLDLAANIFLSCPTQNAPFLGTFRNSNYTYPSDPDIENWGSDFLCTGWKPSNTVPTSVHKLQPADIKVVAAMGDALTTAVGARPSNSSDLMSWRGLSWSIGGDGVLETHTTLPNILKMFNPHIIGFSTGTKKETARLNVATEGATARDMPAQAQELVTRMKKNPEINLEKDWKLITLFIGGNDLCYYCENPEAHSAQAYVQYLQQTLDIFYKELPRTFVNVVEVMELAGLYQGQSGKCTMPLAAQSNCTCFSGSQEKPLDMQKLKQLNWNFQNDLSKISYQHNYTQREDFAVVVQPFFQNTFIPLNNRGRDDLTFFSENCVYFSDRGHAEMAIALWNNMLEPVGHKTTFNNFTYSRTKLKCPSPDHPYFYTLRNSQSLPDQAEQHSNVLNWALPVTFGIGVAVGVGVVMIWTALRR